MAAPEFFASNLYAEPLAASRSGWKSTPRTLFRRAMTILEMSVDCLTYVFCIFVIYFSPHLVKWVQYPAQKLVAASTACGLLGFFLLQKDGACRGNSSLLQIRETERAMRIPAQFLLLSLPFSFFLIPNYVRAIFLLAFLLAPLLFIQKQIFLWMIKALHVRQYGVDRVALYGAGDAGADIISTLLYSPRLGFQPVVVVDDDPVPVRSRIFEMGSRRSHSVSVQSGPVTSALLKSYRCNLLMVAIRNLSPEKRVAATHAAMQAGIKIALIAGPSPKDWQWSEPVDIDGLLLTSMVEPVVPWLYTVAKRAVDLIVSSLFLVTLAPLLLLVGLLVRWDSPGPALFIQKRVGRDGVLFNMYKFRSMHTSVPRYDFSPKESCDPRITRVGRFLRRNSLDELPQLINVFLGNMSLVGPRPEMPFIVQSYNSIHKKRLQVTPGITGLWQLSAARAFSIHENIQYDLYYIRNRNFFMDMAILVHTLFFAMRGGV